MIEPMFHIYTRYDWLLDKALANGEGSVFGASICGPEAFNPFNGRSVIDGATVGVISHKMTPNGKPNVLWGFDPHRMDHDKMTRTIRWVLGTHFGFDTH